MICTTHGVPVTIVGKGSSEFHALVRCEDGVVVERGVAELKADGGFAEIMECYDKAS
jgi:hypothetical protein